MSIARRIAPLLIAGITSPALRNIRRRAAELRRRVSGRPHQVLYFHEVEDPYSHLAAQTLQRLVSRYEIELVPHLVGEADSVPDRDLLAAYARKDAADIAPAYGLDFPRDVDRPEPELAHDAARLLTAVAPAAFTRHAAEIGKALWSRNHAAMEEFCRRLPCAQKDEVRGALAEGSALRTQLGHYSGAMFYYGGEWYWGVDRLGYLEQRLRELGLARDPSDAEPIVPCPSADLTPIATTGGADLVLEYFPSLRSPYTYISMERVYDLAERYGVELRIRPVLPMVMRGMTVPTSKRLYIVFDTKREAERAGIAFGRLSDPLGEPIERGFSLYNFAREHDKTAEYLLSFATGVFAEGIDAGTERGLRRITERAGLVWEDAQASRADDSWRAEFEANREAMFAAGLWGVPSFRVLAGDEHAEFATWGQDRIWLAEQEIRRRLA